MRSKDRQKSKGYTTIVGYGDSITFGSGVSSNERWTTLLDKKLQEHYGEKCVEIINSGVGGETSREGLRRIDKDVLAYMPAIVLVEFGNDPTSEKDRHVDLKEFAANLTEMNHQICAKGGVMVLMTFPPIIHAWHVWAADPFYLEYGGIDLYQEKYRNKMREMATQQNIPLIDIDKTLRNLVLKNGPSEYILRDGVHLTPSGNKVVADLVFNFVINEKLLIVPRKSAQ